MEDYIIVEDIDLVDSAFLYLTQFQYPNGCSDARKRAIRKKAGMFVIRDGVMFFKKKKKGKVMMKVKSFVDLQYLFLKIVELRFIRTREEQLKILKACHIDATAGHMREKKLLVGLRSDLCGLE